MQMVAVPNLGVNDGLMRVFPEIRAPGMERYSAGRKPARLSREGPTTSPQVVSRSTMEKSTSTTLWSTGRPSAQSIR